MQYIQFDGLIYVEHPPPMMLKTNFLQKTKVRFFIFVILCVFNNLTKEKK